MDNQNENNNDFYYGNDDVNAADNAPETVAEETYSQTSQETQEPQPEAANPYGQPNYSGQPYGQQSYGQPYNPYGMPNEVPKKNTCGKYSKNHKYISWNPFGISCMLLLLSCYTAWSSFGYIGNCFNEETGEYQRLCNCRNYTWLRRFYICCCNCYFCNLYAEIRNV